MRLIKDLGRMLPTENSKSKARYGLYECPICYKHFKTQVANVKSGKSTRCQSCSNRYTSTKHGGHKEKLYNVWNSMKQRCYNKNNNEYENYGARGIYVCDEWKNDYKAYREYVSELPNAFKKGYSIDRIDNNKGYIVGNLRWATYAEQICNTRIRKNNNSGFKGVSFDKNRSKWCSEITVNCKKYFLGRFNSKEEAADAYDNYIIENNLERPLNKANKGN